MILSGIDFERRNLYKVDYFDYVCTGALFKYKIYTSRNNKQQRFTISSCGTLRESQIYRFFILLLNGQFPKRALFI